MSNIINNTQIVQQKEDEFSEFVDEANFVQETTKLLQKLDVQNMAFVKVTKKDSKLWFELIETLNVDVKL